LLIAANLKANMDRVIGCVELGVATFDLARISLNRFRSKQAIAAAVKDIHSRVRANPLGLSLVCEGAYLSACAQFEQCIRDLIEETAIKAVGKKGSYALLPDKMQDEHTCGCGRILQNLSQDKYKHLTDVRIVDVLHKCVVTGSTPPNLIVEAFSSNERNFKPKIISEHFKKLGVENIWGSLGKQKCLQAIFNTASATGAEKYSKERLERIMDKRNTIIHRGTGFVAPSVGETKECATFFIAISEALAHLLVAYVASL